MTNEGSDEPPLDAPDTLPDSTKTHGPCNRCGRHSNFTLVGPVTYRKDGTYSVGSAGPERLYDQQVAILECNGCRDRVVVVENEYVGGQLGGRRVGGTVHYRGAFWWPPRGAGGLGADVSAPVAAAYDEGVRCLSAVAPNGAVAMLRTALTYRVEEQGSELAKSRGDLKDKIKQMIADGGPLGALGEWADHIRLYGNAGAHPDKFGDVTLVEAKEVADLVNTMIELLYIVPANIAKRQAERRK